MSPPRCNGEGAALSQHRRTVEKHQARVHSATGQKGRLSTSQLIEPVYMQSLFSQPYHQPFVVCLPSSPLLVSTKDSLARMKRLQQDYNESLEVDRLALQSISTQSDKGQVPPWLVSSGIHQFLAGWRKESVLALIASLSKEEEHLASVGVVVNDCLSAIRQQLTLGVKGGRLSRVGARLLNSFEPGRLHTRVFQVVQEPSTLRRYAQHWSQLLYFLIRMQSRSTSLDEAGSSETMPALDDLTGDLARRAANLARVLHTKEESREAEFDEEATLMKADEKGSLTEVVRQLSIHLTRQDYGESPFNCGVVQYAACLSVNEHGAWKPAHLLSSTYSGLIHCTFYVF